MALGTVVQRLHVAIKGSLVMTREAAVMFFTFKELACYIRDSWDFRDLIIPLVFHGPLVPVQDDHGVAGEIATIAFELSKLLVKACAIIAMRPLGSAVVPVVIHGNLVLGQLRDRSHVMSSVDGG